MLTTITSAFEGTVIDDRILEVHYLICSRCKDTFPIDAMDEATSHECTGGYVWRR